MRKTSENKTLDMLLEEHYNECYEEAMNICKSKSIEDVIAICKLKDDEANAYADSFDYKKAEAENDVKSVLKVGFLLNEACAYKDVSKALTQMGSIN